MIKGLLLLLFNLFKYAKFAKFLTTSGSMLISIVAYSFLFGWPYAVGFVLLIFCHEMGHFIAARQRGLEVGAPTFIPFVGAWIEMKQLPHDAETEAYVGIAGPLAGTLSAILCYHFARTHDSNLLLALSYSGFMINLFNMIPLSPMDGGRITAVLSPKIWWLGAAMMVALFFYFPSPMLIIIALLSLPHLISTFRGNTALAMPAGYYNVPLATRMQYAVFYLGLSAYLAIMSYEVHELLQQRLGRA